MTAWDRAAETALADRSAVGTLRTRRPVRVIDATHIGTAGRRLVNFASNNYLGLSHHPAVVGAFRDAVALTGVGSGAAALVVGQTAEHAAAEAAIARWKGTAAAVLLGSGFAANGAAVATIAAVGRARGGVRFLVDKLAHASLVDAVRSAGATFRIFPHNGLAKLARLLAEADPSQLQVVVSESIFSMDGDAADLAGLAELRHRHGFLLLLDEAHAAGVYGPAGAGLAAERGLSDAVDLSVVTLSKAAGVVGGAVCGSAPWVEAVVNFGRPYIFSTSLPPAVAAAVVAALGVMAQEPDRQARVRQLARHVRSRLTAAGLALPPGDSPIVPVVLGGEAETLAAADRLREMGMLVAAVRPPTVARGTSRLRVTLSSQHTDEEVEAVVSAVVSVANGTATTTASDAAAGPGWRPPPA